MLGPWSHDLVKTAAAQRWSDLPAEQENMSAEEVQAFCGKDPATDPGSV